MRMLSVEQLSIKFQLISRFRNLLFLWICQAFTSWNFFIGKTLGLSPFPFCLAFETQRVVPPFSDHTSKHPPVMQKYHQYINLAIENELQDPAKQQSLFSNHSHPKGHKMHQCDYLSI